MPRSHTMRRYKSRRQFHICRGCVRSQYVFESGLPAAGEVVDLGADERGFHIPEPAAGAQAGELIEQFVDRAAQAGFAFGIEGDCNAAVFAFRHRDVFVALANLIEQLELACGHRVGALSNQLAELRQ